jgi:hypothetical protein
MSSVLTRNVALFGGMIAAGFICAQAALFIQSPRGEGGPCVFMAQQPATAATAIVLCLGLATLLACLVGRLVNAAVGLFVLGAGVFVLDSRLATIRSVVYADADRSTLTSLALECFAMALLALMLVAVVFKVAGGFHDVEPDENGERPHWLFSASALRSAACGVMVLPAVWLVAQSPLKGQALAAAITGSMVAGLAARLIAPHVQPLLIFVSPMVFGAIGHLLAAFTSQPPLDHAYINQSLSVFARVTPMDYLAGSLLGVAMGLGWGKSFLHHEEPASVSGGVARRA